MNPDLQQQCKNQMVMPHIPRPATEQAMKDYNFITKVRDTLISRVLAYRGPKLDNWMSYKRNLVIVITSSLSWQA